MADDVTGNDVHRCEDQRPPHEHQHVRDEGDDSQDVSIGDTPVLGSRMFAELAAQIRADVVRVSPK